MRLKNHYDGGCPGLARIIPQTMQNGPVTTMHPVEGTHCDERPTSAAYFPDVVMNLHCIQNYPLLTGAKLTKSAKGNDNNAFLPRRANPEPEKWVLNILIDG
jgi:hypothetical protein